MEIRKLTLADLTLEQTDKITVDVLVEHIDRFADLSADHSPVHMSNNFAQEQGFSARIAHGLLIGSFISRLIGTRLPGRYGILQSVQIDFRKPLIPPETIEIMGEITSISLSTGQVTMKVTVTDSKGMLITSAQVRTIVKDRQLFQSS